MQIKNQIEKYSIPIQFSFAQSCPTFATPWTEACQASLSFTITRILFKQMSIESVMPSNHLDFCCPLLLLPSIFPSLRIFSRSWILKRVMDPYSMQVSYSNQVSKVLEFQHQSFQWIFRTEYSVLQDGLVGSNCSPRTLKSLLQHYNSKASIL